MSHYTDDPVADAAAHDDEQDRREAERQEREEFLRSYYAAVLKSRDNHGQAQKIVDWIESQDCILAAEAFVLYGPDAALRILQSLADAAVKNLAESEA